MNVLTVPPAWRSKVLRHLYLASIESTTRQQSRRREPLTDILPTIVPTASMRHMDFRGWPSAVVYLQHPAVCSHRNRTYYRGLRALVFFCGGVLNLWAREPELFSTSYVCTTNNLGGRVHVDQQTVSELGLQVVCHNSMARIIRANCLRPSPGDTRLVRRHHPPHQVTRQTISHLGKYLNMYESPDIRYLQSVARASGGKKYMRE